MRQTLEHEAGHSGIDERLARTRELLIVLAQAAIWPNQAIARSTTHRLGRTPRKPVRVAVPRGWAEAVQR